MVTSNRDFITGIAAFVSDDLGVKIDILLGANDTGLVEYLLSNDRHITHTQHVAADAVGKGAVACLEIHVAHRPEQAIGAVSNVAGVDAQITCGNDRHVINEVTVGINGHIANRFDLGVVGEIAVSRNRQRTSGVNILAVTVKRQAAVDRECHIAPSFNHPRLIIQAGQREGHIAIGVDRGVNVVLQVFSLHLDVVACNDCVIGIGDIAILHVQGGRFAPRQHGTAAVGEVFRYVQGQVVIGRNYRRTVLVGNVIRRNGHVATRH